MQGNKFWRNIVNFGFCRVSEGKGKKRINKALNRETRLQKEHSVVARREENDAGCQ
jgi:hypothetical protein